MGKTYDAKLLYSLRDEVMALGIPQSDAELVVDSMLSGRSASWINNENIEMSAVNDKLVKYLEDKKCAIKVKVEECGIGKFIWDIKAKSNEEYFPPTF